jgi:hypothetical protein
MSRKRAASPDETANKRTDSREEIVERLLDSLLYFPNSRFNALHKAMVRTCLVEQFLMCARCGHKQDPDGRCRMAMPHLSIQYWKKEIRCPAKKNRPLEYYCAKCYKAWQRTCVACQCTDAAEWVYLPISDYMCMQCYEIRVLLDPPCAFCGLQQLETRNAFKNIQDVIRGDITVCEVCSYTHKFTVKCLGRPECRETVETCGAITPPCCNCYSMPSDTEIDEYE